jgi:hypothetical protein
MPKTDVSMMPRGNSIPYDTCDPHDGGGIGVLDSFLAALHRRIAITSIDRIEADRHVKLLTTVLYEDIGGEVYVNGSIVQGDAMSPLRDIDVGIVLDVHDPRCMSQCCAPTRLVEEACRVLLTSLRKELPYAIGTLDGQRRSILISFGSQDYCPGVAEFTADVIVALNYRGGRGIPIPDLFADQWERSDPMTHIELIRNAALTSNQSFIRIVRLAKYWSRHHGTPLYSWNIKALALKCLVNPMPLATGLRAFFQYAAESVSRELTPDPAGVSAPIRLGLSRHQAVMHLKSALVTMDYAIENAEAGRAIEAIRAIRTLFL